MLSYQTIRKPCIVVNTWLVTSDAIHVSPVGRFIWKPLSRDCSLIIHLGVLLVGFVFVYLVFCFVLCCVFFVCRRPVSCLTNKLLLLRRFIVLSTRGTDSNPTPGMMVLYFVKPHKFRMCYNPDKLHGIKWVFQSKLKMNCYRTVDKNSTTGVTSGAGTSHPSGASDFTPFSSWNSCCSIFGFCVEFDRTLFVFVYCSLWALYVLLPIEVSD